MRVCLFIILILAIAVSSGYAETQVINISVYSIKESTKLFTISAEYPQIDKVESDFNDKIKSLVEAKIGDFKKNSEGNWRARKETSTPDENLGEYPEKPFFFDISCEPAQLNGKYISFVLHLGFYEGGANANQVVFAFNYDLLNNKEMMLNDLLGGYPDYLKTISDYSIKELESNITAEGNADILKEMINQGAGPKEDNFRNFTFTDKVVNVHFSKYDVLPGYFGEQEVHIPRSIFWRK